MVLSAFRRFAKQTLPAFRQARCQPRRHRLHCEELEPRLQPSLFFFASGFPDGRIGTISEPPDTHNSHVEFESADDFVLTQRTQIVSATFPGLLTGGATLRDVDNVFITIYRVFPNDSDVGRTSGPPTFRTDRVPTRVNSPADNEIINRDFLSHQLVFQPSVINPSFTTQSSVSSADKISVKSGGNGPATGEEVAFTVTFQDLIDLPAGHYFFVPKVGLRDDAPAGADFLWLSAPKPIQPPGTNFTPDLQSWMREDPGLAPDWLRIGTDIIGGTTFNGSFALNGQIVTDGIPGAPPARSAAVDNLFADQSALLFNGLLGTPAIAGETAPTNPLAGTTPAPVNLQSAASADTVLTVGANRILQSAYQSGAASGQALQDHDVVSNWSGDFIPALA